MMRDISCKIPGRLSEARNSAADIEDPDHEAGSSRAACVGGVLSTTEGVEFALVVKAS